MAIYGNTASGCTIIKWPKRRYHPDELSGPGGTPLTASAPSHYWYLGCILSRSLMELTIECLSAIAAIWLQHLRWALICFASLSSASSSGPNSDRVFGCVIHRHGL